MFRSSLARKEITAFPAHELRLDRQLLAGEAERLLGERLRARRRARTSRGPGLTTATQPSGEPLPLPMRVSAGFFVYDLSGKTLIQTFPPRRILRVIAIRAASICRLVIQPSSSALMP